ncbi:MAG: hypothetical protein KJ571_01310 [Bacteroidetes bacterium]|nr:hypothetical protein [Bacteroidota bacterium]
MLIKKYSRFIFAIFSLLFSGCLNYEQITTIKKDASGEMFIHYWTNISQMPDSLLIYNSGIFNKDSLANKYISPFTTIDFTEVYNDYLDSTIHAKVKFIFTNIDSLNKIPAFRNYNFIFNKNNEDEYIFSQDVNYFQFTPDSSQNFTMKFTYYLPGRVLFHNANSLSQNKLEWEFSINEADSIKQLTAKFEPFRLNETPPWIYYSGIFVFIVVLYFLFRFKKT